MGLTIRDAAPSDEQAVTRLWQRCGLTTDYNDPVADFRFALDGPASTILVAFEATRLVGSVLVGHDGHRGWIYYVATDPDRQANGIGRAVVGAAEAWLRSRGVPKLHLMVRETNAQVTGFYARLGYEEMPRIMMSKWLRPDEAG